VATNYGAARGVKPGVALPSIQLPATDGSKVDLAAIKGKRVVVIYPWTGRAGHPKPPDWDEIPGAHGSTPELEGLRDAFPGFVKLGTKLFGLSRQTSAWQSEMAARLDLPFPILSDADGAFTSALDLPSFATGGEIYLTRLTLLIDDGQIERVFHPVPEPGLHASEVLAWLKRQT
jgi:peroxiredoxin